MSDLKQTDDANFLRDITNNALINRNVNELQILKAQRDKFIQRDKEVNDLKQQIEELKLLIQNVVRGN
jgi:hypothetical protein